MKQVHRPLKDLYRIPLAMLTDQYQLTMAYVHWLMGTGEREAVFHLYFRKTPFEGGYAVSSGLTHAIDYVSNYRFTARNLQTLSRLVGNDGKPLFHPGFLEYLGKLRLKVDIDAMPEGTVVFGNEPMMRVKGPIIQGHLLETPLLTLSNFPTLVATKASRITYAANGKPCFEYGMRRAQGIDGALMASWASFVGGFAGTSNLQAMELYGIPSGGTMAHALVMSFEEELKAFEAYADALPNNCVFLVDTYNSIEGIKKAIKVGLKLRARGYEMNGIRLDSGDLADLSQKARQMLDEAGFPKARVFCSNDLDEKIIQSLNAQGARICVYGVGTKVVTCFDQPALGAVYKLGAILDGKGWRFPIKVSEQVAKTTTPGIQQVRRFIDQNGRFVGDMIYNELVPPAQNLMVDPYNDTRENKMIEGTHYAVAKDLLVPIARRGKIIYQSPALPEIQAYAKAQLASLPEGVRRFENPAEYPVRMERGLFDLRRELIVKARAA